MGFSSLDGRRPGPTTAWGPCITQIPAAKRDLYLTFDDGPSANGTPAVLELLEELECPATFFLVATRAERARSLVARTISRGHAIGNHSLDHSWRPFFGSPSALRRWIADAEQRLADVSGAETVGFRSPAGVRTPPLHWALAELDLPLVHWNVRFFDRARAWTESRALDALERASPGSIVLLHDVQASHRLETFLETLRTFVTQARAHGFQFERLERSKVRRAQAVGAGSHSSGAMS